MHIVIPAAGEGRRFVEAGYPSKVAADVLGAPMLRRVVDNVRDLFPGEHRVTVVTTSEAISVAADVVRLKAPTRGAVETILAADIRDGERLLIANCDQLVRVRPGAVAFGFADGLVLTFRSSKPHHSYVRTDEHGFIREIAEKQVISHDAVAGVYVFEDGAQFRDAAEKVLADDRRVLGEFYVSTVLDEMLAGGAKLRSVDSQVAILGTPEELDLFVMAAQVAAQVSADKLRNYVVNGAMPESVMPA